MRREMIVSAAANLFRERGYSGTSLDDIGAAVGTTGPAIYRHFPSKEALLTELLERAVERAQRDVKSVASQRLAPRPALEAIVRRSVAHALEESDLVVMASEGVRNLSASTRQRISRGQRVVIEAWVAALRRARPELDREQARAIVRGVVALAQAVSRSGRVDRAWAEDRFVRMALAALSID
ncbi:Transcriptional repressor Mce3R [Myxococcaceae bacterium]|jgi:AcrR family transcriptional regulator|nr:Transcriptional repressor Mce3R [Myxococcaceae bacterium]